MGQYIDGKWYLFFRDSYDVAGKQHIVHSWMPIPELKSDTVTPFTLGWDKGFEVG